jgi:large subunit ribosomal protein L5
MTVAKKSTPKDVTRTKVQAELSIANAFAVPRVQKVVVNVGLGRLVSGAAKPDDVIEGIRQDLAQITGQRPIITKARKSIASFKVRKGMPLGVKVTLRGRRMWDFLSRLVNIALPRSRDFRGVSFSGIDEGGSMTVGVREHTVFPEAAASPHSMGLEVTVVSSAKSRDEALALFRALGFPFKKADER